MTRASLRVRVIHIEPTHDLCGVGDKLKFCMICMTCMKRLKIGSIREWHSLVVILQHLFAAAPFNTSVVASVVHLTVTLSATEVV